MTAKGTIGDIAETQEKYGWKKTIIAGCWVVLGAAGVCWITTKIKSYQKKKVNSSKEEDKRATEELKHKNKMEEIKAKAEAKMCIEDHRVYLRKNDTSDIDPSIDPTMQTLEQICDEGQIDLSSLQLGYPYIVKGSSLGICGQTEIGKTTLLIQILLALASGYQEIPLAPVWNQITPQKVLLFSTEQSKPEIRALYNKAKGMTGNLLIETEGMTLEEILAKVHYQLDRANSEGIVIAIDNYTKLMENYGLKKIKELDRKLTTLQIKYQEKKPITLIKVFHTDKTYRPYSPISEYHIKGSANLVNLTKNFVFLTKCREGDNTRILKIFKNKIGYKPETVSILKYAGTDPKMYVYDKEAKEEDVLPLKPLPMKEENLKECKHASGKVGRPPCYSDDDILKIIEIHQSGSRWAEIEEVFGISRKAVQNRHKKIMKRRLEERH